MANWRRADDGATAEIERLAGCAGRIMINTTWQQLTPQEAR